jgi:hypothetical protein
MADAMAEVILLRLDAQNRATRFQADRKKLCDGCQSRSSPAIESILSASSSGCGSWLLMLGKPPGMDRIPAEAARSARGQHRRVGPCERQGEDVTGAGSS